MWLLGGTQSITIDYLTSLVQVGGLQFLIQSVQWHHSRVTAYPGLANVRQVGEDLLDEIPSSPQRSGPASSASEGVAFDTQRYLSTLVGMDNCAPSQLQEPRWRCFDDRVVLISGNPPITTRHSDWPHWPQVARLRGSWRHPGAPSHCRFELAPNEIATLGRPLCAFIANGTCPSGTCGWVCMGGWRRACGACAPELCCPVYVRESLQIERRNLLLMASCCDGSCFSGIRQRFCLVSFFSVTIWRHMATCDHLPV